MRLKQRRCIRTDEDDLVTGPDAMRQQRICQLVDAFLKFDVGVPEISIDYGNLIRIYPNAPSEKRNRAEHITIYTLPEHLYNSRIIISRRNLSQHSTGTKKSPTMFFAEISDSLKPVKKTVFVCFIAG
jgi:hypothetical protein